MPNPQNGFFSMGDHTHSVPMELFAKNRRRLCEKLREAGAPEKSVVLLQGGSEHGRCYGDSSDMGLVFRQESYFHWAFGVLEPDFFGAIDVNSGKTVLFIPRLPQEYAIWMGKLLSVEDIKAKYCVAEVRFVDELRSYLGTFVTDPTLLVMEGLNTDSGKQVFTAAFDGISDFALNRTLLQPIIAECRVIKTDMELDALRYASKISSKAHMEVMRQIKPGMKEYQCESIFLNYSYLHGGCRHVSYTCIAGSGDNCSVLHYGHAGAPNDKTIDDGDMVLYDMGAEYYCFSSDITCSYPANGKFTEKQRVIYEGVHKAVRAVFRACKPGVNWVDMHLLSNRTLLEHLLEIGLLQGQVDDMMAVNLYGMVFQPCGLGHFIGLDVHDVGGYLEGHPARPKGRGLKSLRTARDLKAGMVITIEPGCYFQDHLLDEAAKDPELSKFLVAEKMAEYRGFGGVRIEEDIIITEDGAELMSIVPRTVGEIERWMAEGVFDEPKSPFNYDNCY